MTFDRLRQRYASCEYVAAAIGSVKNLLIGKQPGRVRVLWVSVDYFEVLGVEPALGREFSPDDERLGAPLSVVLSDGLWHSRFGGDESVLGGTVIFGGELHTVVGVMPQTFRSSRQGTLGRRYASTSGARGSTTKCSDAFAAVSPTARPKRS
jgi:MacB-like periplasmic core domain